MSAIRQDQLENASRFMTAAWKEIIKPYYNAEDTDEYWIGLLDKLNEFYDRFDLYNNRQLIEMLLGFTCGLEMHAGNERRISCVEELREKMIRGKHA